MQGGDPVTDGLDLVWVHLESLEDQNKAQKFCESVVKHVFLMFSIESML